MKTRHLAALATILGLPAAARAQEAPPPPPPAVVPAPAPTHVGAASEFGGAGQVVIDVDVPFQNEASQLALIHSSASMGQGTSTLVVVRPSADYFVAPHVSVGGLIGYARGDVAFGGAGVSSGSSITELLIGARAGYDMPMTDLVSIWGRVELVYVHFSGGGSGYDVPLMVNVPILLHPAPHFFLGVGPTFSTDLLARANGQDVTKATNYGLQGIIGGYFGGG